MTAERLPLRAILERASRAVGKINEHGLRGTTMVTVEETEAMALALVGLGLSPTHAGQAPLVCLFVPNGVMAAEMYFEGPQEVRDAE